MPKASDKRNHSISAKLTKSERERIEPLLQGEKPATWLRKVVLDQVNREPFEESVMRALQVLMAEQAGLCAVVVNVISDLASGVQMTPERVRQHMEVVSGNIKANKVVQ